MPGQAIDESLIAGKVWNPIRQYLPNKQDAWFGTKVWLLVDSENAYVYEGAKYDKKLITLMQGMRHCLSIDGNGKIVWQMPSFVYRQFIYNLCSSKLSRATRHFYDQNNATKSATAYTKWNY